MQSGCVICQDPFDAAVGIVTTKCGHVFHNICIEQWLRRSSTCPECRRNVCNKHLMKLFFNTSFDDTSGKNASLDALKKQLHIKDLEIFEKDKKIKELQTCCANSERHVEKMHQRQMELENEICAIKSEVQKLRRGEARNQMLLLENSALQSELDHLNNVKKIVEGCCLEAKKILDDFQIHVESAEGKEATHRIATYCSVIKWELARKIGEKTQIQNELTKVKHQMGILKANYAKKIRLLEQQVKMLEDQNSSSQSAYCGPVGVKTNYPSQCLSKSALEDCKNQLTPISFDFPKNKRQKMHIVVLDRETAKISTQVPETPVLRLAKSAQSSRPENEDSVSRVGYNGLGGHGRVVTGSGAKWPLNWIG